MKTYWIAYENSEGRIVVTDSFTYCDRELRIKDVVVSGSFAGDISAAMVLQFGACAFLANAAGFGLDDAGVAGLELAQRLGAPAAALSETSAALGDGTDSYHNGVVVRLNLLARNLGVREGMRCSEAAMRFLKAGPGKVGRGSEYVDKRQEVVYQGPEGTVVAMATVSSATLEDADRVLCVGSHMGTVTWNYVKAAGFSIRGVIGNDGGIGKNGAGIAALVPLDSIGVPAASVNSMSARIGDGRSTYKTGAISHCNVHARNRGVVQGQTTKEACHLLLTANR